MLVGGGWLALLTLLGTKESETQYYAIKVLIVNEALSPRAYGATVPKFFAEWWRQEATAEWWRKEATDGSV